MMINAQEVSSWLAREDANAAREEEARAQEAKKRQQESRAGKMAVLQQQLEDVDSDIGDLEQSLSTAPPVYLHNRFDLTTKRRMKLLMSRFDEVELFVTTGFNPAFLRFGAKWFTVVSMLASMALAFQWMQSRFGLDAVGGSEVATIMVTAGLALAVDLISFMLLGGLLVSLKLFLGRQRHVTALSFVIAFSSLVGVVGFVSVVIQRFVEAGL